MASMVSDTLTLLKEYTELKRMIDHCKRQNERKPRYRQQFTSMSSSFQRRSALRPRFPSNPYVLRTNITYASSSKYSRTAPAVSPNAVALQQKPSKSTASKYSWSSTVRASTENPPSSSSSASVLTPALPPTPTASSSTANHRAFQDPQRNIRKTSNKYKVVNFRSNIKVASPAVKKLRQVRKYSVKYLPVNGRSIEKSRTPIDAKTTFFDGYGRYVLRRRRSILQSNKTDNIRSNHQTKFIVIGNLAYRMSKTKLKLAHNDSSKSVGASSSRSSKSLPPTSRTMKTSERPSAGKERIVRVRGVKFIMDPLRKTLRRVAETSPEASSSTQTLNSRALGVSRVDIGCVTYMQSQPGILVRSSGKQLRSMANRVVNRSIIRLTVKRQRSQQFCMFYNKFGKCSKLDKGDICPYVHDPDKIAVCKRFLKGACQVTDCAFSHRLCRLKMPVCMFFVRGRCTSDACPYRHVNVNRDAGVCVDFNRGYCPHGEQCKKWHVYDCPQFKKDGKCARGDKCPLQHSNDRRYLKDKPKVDHVPIVKATEASRLRSTTEISTANSLPSFISLSDSSRTLTSESIVSMTPPPPPPPPLAIEGIQIRPKFGKPFSSEAVNKR